MKTLLCIILTVHAISAQTTLSLSGPSVKPRTQATLNVTLSGASGQNIAGLQWSVQIPPGLNPAVSIGPAATGASKDLACAPNGTAGIICLLTGINTNTIADGVVAYVKFIPQNAGMLNFGLSGTLGASLVGDAITVGAVAPFGFAVTSPCDWNGDGSTDVLDVQGVITAALAGGACTADLDGDGKCTVIDVVRVTLAVLGQTCKAN